MELTFAKKNKRTRPYHIDVFLLYFIPGCRNCENENSGPHIFHFILTTYHTVSYLHFCMNLCISLSLFFLQIIFCIFQCKAKNRTHETNISVLCEAVMDTRKYSNKKWDETFLWRKGFFLCKLESKSSEEIMCCIFFSSHRKPIHFLPFFPFFPAHVLQIHKRVIGSTWKCGVCCVRGFSLFFLSHIKTQLCSFTKLQQERNCE